MQKIDTYIRHARVSQWTSGELALLRDLAPKKTRSVKLIELFPGRTIGSIKIKLMHTRRSMGIPKMGNTNNLRRAANHVTMLDKNDPGLPSDYPVLARAAAAASNAAFLAALGIAA